MNILLINHFPLEGSGSGTYTKNIAEYLTRRGHKVCVLFPENRIPAELPGVEMRPVFFTGGSEPVPGALPFNFPCFTTHPRSQTTFADLTSRELEQYLEAFDQAIGKAVQNFKPDLIHGQHLWCLTALAAKTGVPCIATTHGTDLMGYEKWPDIRHFASDAAQGCKRIISISKDNLSIIEEKFPGIRGKTTLLMNGYDETVFYPEKLDRAALLSSLGIYDHGERIVLFAGKFTAFKGIDTLLEAASFYEQDLPGKTVTLLAGSGSEEASLRAMADRLGLQSVYFIGHKSQPELRRLYSSADVTVVPSRREPFGLVALEAMACGCPVVGTDEGGLPDFVSPEAGTLVNTYGPYAHKLSNAILREISRSEQAPGRRAAIAKYAQENFCQSRYMDQLEGIYVETLKEC